MRWLRKFCEGLAKPTPQGNELDETLSDFSPRGQQVLLLARKQAERFQHNFVGTEHVLLGLIGLGQGTGFTVLKKMGVDLDMLRASLEKEIGNSQWQLVIDIIPHTPRVEKVLRLARKEAESVKHTWIGTEHILLGLLREGDGLAGQVLKGVGLNLDQVRERVIKEVDPDSHAR
jgi:ATP-dependent Clp protease ATP-binding subunit ClpC